MPVYQAQRELKNLVDTTAPIFEHNHIALLYCSNGADFNKIKQAITQTQRAVDMWFTNARRNPRLRSPHFSPNGISRLLIFTPDEPLGKQLIKEMRSTNAVAGSTEAKTRTIIIAGYPSQDDFWTTLRHELTHDAMLGHYGTAESLPPFWITEGLATAFEVPAYADGKPTINSDRLNRLKSICQQGKLDLLPLITQIAHQRATSAQYAQAWGLTFYLLCQDSTAMRRYLADYQQQIQQTPTSHQSVFEKHFLNNESLSDLTDKLQRWVTLQTSTSQ